MELPLDVESTQVVGDGVKPARRHEKDTGLPGCLRILLLHLLHELEEEGEAGTSFVLCNIQWNL